jgi:hypothetical protein
MRHRGLLPGCRGRHHDCRHGHEHLRRSGLHQGAEQTLRDVLAAAIRSHRGDVAGRYLEPGVKAKTKEEKSAEIKEKQGNLVSFPLGVIKFVRSTVLRKFYKRFVDDGHIVVMDHANETAAQKEEYGQALARFKEEKRENQETDARVDS